MDDTQANVERLLEGRGGEERIFELRQALSQAGSTAIKAREEYDNSQKVSKATVSALVVVVLQFALRIRVLRVRKVFAARGVLISPPFRCHVHAPEVSAARSPYVLLGVAKRNT